GAAKKTGREAAHSPAVAMTHREQRIFETARITTVTVKEVHQDSLLERTTIYLTIYIFRQSSHPSRCVAQLSARALRPSPGTRRMPVSGPRPRTVREHVHRWCFEASEADRRRHTTHSPSRRRRRHRLRRVRRSRCCAASPTSAVHAPCCLRTQGPA